MCGTAGTHSDSYYSYYTTVPALQVSSPGHRKGKNNLSRFTQLMEEKACRHSPPGGPLSELTLNTPHKHVMRQTTADAHTCINTL